jgi:DNA polymerase III delta prime subunit
METLGKVSGGDLRKAITTLQSAVRLKVAHASYTGPQIAHLLLFWLGWEC